MGKVFTAHSYCSAVAFRGGIAVDYMQRTCNATVCHFIATTADFLKFASRGGLE